MYVEVMHWANFSIVLICRVLSSVTIVSKFNDHNIETATYDFVNINIEPDLFYTLSIRNIYFQWNLSS